MHGLRGSVVFNHEIGGREAVDDLPVAFFTSTGTNTTLAWLRITMS